MSKLTVSVAMDNDIGIFKECIQPSNDKSNLFGKIPI